MSNHKTYKFNYFFKRVTTWLLLCLFGISQMAGANPGLGQLQTIRTPFVPISISSDIGLVEESFEGRPGSPILFLIKDAHVNVSAQKNINLILEQIYRQFEMDAIFTEAASEDVSLRYLRAYKTNSETKKIAEQYLNKGLIHGVEYFNLVSEYDSQILGVEDPELYHQAEQIFFNVMSQHSTHKPLLTKLKAIIHQAKQKFYSPDLLYLDKHKTLYEQSQITIMDYIKILLQLGQHYQLKLPQALTNIQKISKIEESIDFTQLNQDVQSLIDMLHGEEQSQLIEAFSLFQHNVTSISLDNHQLSQKLVHLLKEYVIHGTSHNQDGMNGDVVKNISRYIDYMQLFLELNQHNFFNQIEFFEHVLIDRLHLSPMEQNIHLADGVIKYYEQLLQFQIQPNDFMNTNNITFLERPELVLELINSFLLEGSVKTKRFINFDETFTHALSDAKRFYELANLRDYQMLKNMMRFHQEVDVEKNSILIVGGYHELNIKLILKKINHAYVVLSPNVLHETNTSQYQNLIMSQAKAHALPSNRYSHKSSQNTLMTGYIRGTQIKSPSSAMAFVSEYPSSAWQVPLNSTRMAKSPSPTKDAEAILGDQLTWLEKLIRAKKNDSSIPKTTGPTSDNDIQTKIKAIEKQIHFLKTQLMANIDNTLGDSDILAQTPDPEGLANSVSTAHGETSIEHLRPINAPDGSVHYISVGGEGKAFEHYYDQKAKQWKTLGKNRKSLAKVVRDAHNTTSIYHLRPINAPDGSVHYISVGQGKTFEHYYDEDTRQWQTLPEEDNSLAKVVRDAHKTTLIFHLRPINAPDGSVHYISMGYEGKAFEHYYDKDTKQWKTLSTEDNSLAKVVRDAHETTWIRHLRPINAPDGSVHYISVGRGGKAFSHDIYKDTPQPQPITPTNAQSNPQISRLIQKLQDEREALLKKMGASRMTRYIVEYYSEKQNLLNAIRSGGRADIIRNYDLLLQALDGVTDIPGLDMLDWQDIDAQLAQKNIALSLRRPMWAGSPEVYFKHLKNEIQMVAQKQFSPANQELVDQLVREIAEELFDGEKIEFMYQIMRASVKTFYFGDVLPKDFLLEVFDQEPKVAEQLLKQISGMTNSFGMFAPAKKSVYSRDMPDELTMRSTVKHELFHFLASRAVFETNPPMKVPTGWENITYAVDVLDRITHHPDGIESLKSEALQKEYIEPALFELFDHGLTTGKDGLYAFTVLPGVSDRHSSYFSDRMLRLEVRAVYEAKGITGPALERLQDDYHMMKAIGIMMAGVIWSQKKDNQSLAEFKPLRRLKDFFDVLWDRYGDKTLDHPGLQQRIDQVASDVRQYASSSAGEPVKLVKVAGGWWQYLPNQGAGGAQQHYVVSDMHPRIYDGHGPDDIDGQMIAARERTLGHSLLSIARVKFGLRGLIPQLPEGIREHPALRPLWDGLLLPKTMSMGLDFHLSSLSMGSIDSQYEGAKKWMMRVFQDKYQIDDMWVARGLLEPLGLHRKFIDALIYMRLHYDPANPNVEDPRITDPLIIKAVDATKGSLTDVDHYGWAKLMYFPDEVIEAQILSIIQNIWAVYLDLYDQEIELQKRWRTYQDKMQAEKQAATKKAFEQLSQQQLQALDEDFDAQTPEQQAAIEDDIIGDMNNDEPLEGCASAGSCASPLPGDASGSPQSDGQPGETSGQSSESMPMGDGMRPIGDGISQMQALLSSASDAIDQLESALQGMGNQTQGMAQQPNPTDTAALETAAQGVQGAAVDAANLGDDIQHQAHTNLGTAHTLDVPDDLANPGHDLTDAADQVSEDSNILMQNLQDLIDKANQLLQAAQALNQVTQAGGDQQQIIAGHKDTLSSAIQAIKEAIQNSQNTSQTIAQGLGELSQILSQVESAIQNATTPSGDDSPDSKPDDGAKPDGGINAAEAANNAGIGGDAQTVTTQEAATSPPTIDEMQPQIHIPGAQSLFDALDQTQTQPTKAPRAIKAPPFDLAKAQKDEEAALFKRTGLKPEEYAIHQARLNINLISNNKSITVGQLIEEVTGRFLKWSRLIEEIRLKQGLEIAPIFSDPTGMLTGGPMYGQMQPTEPVDLLLTVVSDTSESMKFDSAKRGDLYPIDVVRIINFVMANALLNLNETRLGLGYTPVPFEIGFFDHEEGRTQISHQSVLNNEFRRERFLFEMWNNSVASGGTAYAKNLNKYSGRLIQAAEGASYRVVQALIVLTDEDVDGAQRQAVLGAYASIEENNAHIFFAPLGNDAQIRGSVELHRDHSDRVIVPLPFESLMERIIDALETVMPPELETARMADIERTSIEGYEHFYYQKQSGRTFLVYDNGQGPRRYWQKGFGGIDVPSDKTTGKRATITETPETELKIVRLLDALYRPGLIDTSYTDDGHFWIRVRQNESIELLQRNADLSWNTITKFPAIQQTSLKVPDIGKLPTPIAQDWESQAKRLGDLAEWNYYASENLIALQHPRSRVVRIYQISGSKADKWEFVNELQIQAEEGPDSMDGRHAELVGETGLGKDKLLDAVAALIDTEVVYGIGHEGVHVEQLESAFRTMSTTEEFTSSYLASGLNQAIDRNAIYALREAHRLRPGVKNSVKSHISAKTYRWPIKEGNQTRLITLPAPSRGRLVTSINRKRKGIMGYSEENNSPMQDRKEQIEFYWNNPNNEQTWQLQSALDFARQLGNHSSDWATFTRGIKSDVNQLVQLAAELRLGFFGFDATQQAAIFNDWDLLDPTYLAIRMMADPAIKRLFQDGPKEAIGVTIKRPPSPRVIEHIIHHFVKYPQDRKYRAYDIVRLYFNYYAELDPANTYVGAMQKFEQFASPLTQAVAPTFDDNPLVKDNQSFRIDGDSLVITSLVVAGQNPWDEIRVPLHSKASIRQGRVPDSVLFWLKSSKNRLKFYRYMQGHSLGMSAIFVGDAGTGKSKHTKAIQELLNAPGILKVEVTEETREDHLFFQREVIKRQLHFVPQAIPLAMDTDGEGQIINSDETTQGVIGILSLWNEVAERGEVADPRKSFRLLQALNGFGAIHTINRPGSAEGVKAFTDDFIERHISFDYEAPEIESVAAYAEEAGWRNRWDDSAPVRLNPALIGEPKDPAEIFPDGETKYTGLVGVAQILNRKYIENSDAFPKGRQITVRNLQHLTKNIVDRYDLYHLTQGLSSQEALVNIFLQTFTMDGPMAKQVLWRATVLDAFKTQGLWNSDGDSIEKLLGYQDVLVQALPVLISPVYAEGDLKEVLEQLQTTVIPGSINKTLSFLSQHIQEDLNPNKWPSTNLEDKVKVLRAYKEAYDILGNLIKERGDVSKPPSHEQGIIQKFEAIQSQIKTLFTQRLHWHADILDKDWPQGMDTDVQAIHSGHAQIDESLLRQRLFATDIAYLAKEDKRLRALIQSNQAILDLAQLEQIKVIISATLINSRMTSFLATALILLAQLEQIEINAQVARRFLPYDKSEFIDSVGIRQTPPVSVSHLSLSDLLFQTQQQKQNHSPTLSHATTPIEAYWHLADLAQLGFIEQQAVIKNALVELQPYLGQLKVLHLVGAEQSTSAVMAIANSMSSLQLNIELLKAGDTPLFADAKQVHLMTQRTYQIYMQTNPNSSHEQERRFIIAQDTESIGRASDVIDYGSLWNLLSSVGAIEDLDESSAQLSQARVTFNRISGFNLDQNDFVGWVRGNATLVGKYAIPLLFKSIDIHQKLRFYQTISRMA